MSENINNKLKLSDNDNIEFVNCDWGINDIKDNKETVDNFDSTCSKKIIRTYKINFSEDDYRCYCIEKNKNGTITTKIHFQNFKKLMESDYSKLRLKSFNNDDTYFFILFFGILFGTFISIKIIGLLV